MRARNEAKRNEALSLTLARFVLICATLRYARALLQLNLVNLWAVLNMHYNTSNLKILLSQRA